ncbi:MAG: hypothetical protein JJT75_11225 [Opitutales bacterium]|nr:hypothetical protein [Opitutales bacterium]
MGRFFPVEMACGGVTEPNGSPAGLASRKAAAGCRTPKTASPSEVQVRQTMNPVTLRAEGTLDCGKPLAAFSSRSLLRR